MGSVMSRDAAQQRGASPPWWMSEPLEPVSTFAGGPEALYRLTEAVDKPARPFITARQIKSDG